MHEDKFNTITWARQSLLYPHFQICDTETTGLGATAEICQIAFINRFGEVLMDTLIKPQEEIPAEATAIHGITNEMITDAPSFPEVWPRIEELLTSKHTVIYNADYDTRIIQQCLQRHGIECDPFIWDVACAMKKYSAFVGQKGRYGDWKWQKLPGGAHTALSDCLAVLDVIKLMRDSKSYDSI